ncbi:uncharacterized protein LOC141531209 isoform X2 [Cotesia typhae]|uniref:uncharacterized protein LOC141531209 isoform X2 n=1 Tax=Cotesia typhae TaxID=2053667 RepID=UPI003D69C771
MSNNKSCIVTECSIKMNSAKAEKRLAILYSAAALLSVISFICIITTWQYWAWTLDSCFETDCNCIFYGVNAFSKLRGGDVKICHFATYAVIPSVLFSIGFGLYHGYRTCINKKLSEPKIIARRSVNFSSDEIDGNVVVVTPKSRSPCKHWTPTTFLAALITCLSLAHAIVITDGYYKTCEQYKKRIIHVLGSSGREAAVHNRLSCSAIFDYMDYIEPDSNNWRRGDEMNTGLALLFALISIWSNFIIWIIIFIINFVMARQRHRNSSEKSCCC